MEDKVRFEGEDEPDGIAELPAEVAAGGGAAAEATESLEETMLPLATREAEDEGLETGMDVDARGTC